MMPDLDVVIVGPVAPPRGGVSAHVERLARLLEKDGLLVGILDHFSNKQHPLVIGTLKRNPLRYWQQMHRLNASVVHYHHANWLTLIAAAIARRPGYGTWIATFHGARIDWSLGSRAPGIAMLTRWAMGRFDRIIAVSDAVAENIRQQTGSTVILSPAYLPSTDWRRDDSESGPTAVVAAYRVASKSSEDLYGLDIAIAVFVAASACLPSLRLKMYLAQEPASHRACRYLDEVLRPLRDAKLQDRFTLHVGAELTSAFQPGAVYLRTTRTDGDAVSIREALDAAIPVLASDVVQRPAGVVPLQLDDVPAWVAAVCDAVQRPPKQAATPQWSSDQADALTKLYRSALDHRIAVTQADTVPVGGQA
jgi:glycosyltransferase involved in cell wall biosynthesis